MTHRAISQDHALTSQHALSEEEYAAASRCQAEHRWAFGAFLRGSVTLPVI
jgi:hypothetical protein